MIFFLWNLFKLSSPQKLISEVKSQRNFYEFIPWPHLFFRRFGIQSKEFVCIECETLKCKPVSREVQEMKHCNKFVRFLTVVKIEFIWWEFFKFHNNSTSISYPNVTKIITKSDNVFKIIQSMGAENLNWINNLNTWI
jgi:hypothetical protein